MEKTLTPIQQLDEILKYISRKIGDKIEGKYYPKETLAITMFADKLNPQLENIELKSILEKLIKDGHIDTFENPAESNGKKIKYYYSTFDGRLFNQTGGYSTDLKRRATSASLQTLALWLTAVGTALAGLYGLVELIRWIYRVWPL